MFSCGTLVSRRNPLSTLITDIAMAAAQLTSQLYTAWRPQPRSALPRLGLYCRRELARDVFCNGEI